MTTVLEIQTAIQTLQASATAVDEGLSKAQADMAALTAEVQALKDQLAAGAVVTPADLDSIMTGLQGVQTTLTEAQGKEAGL